MGRCSCDSTDTCPSFSATLDLHKNALTGDIPPEIFNLNGLLHLFVNQNPDLGGEMSPLFNRLLSLQRLRLGDTNMGGTIPDEIFQMTTLIEFEIPRDKFSGNLESMSDRLLNLTLLEDLDLAFNDFTGPLPDIFWKFPNLGEFHLCSKFCHSVVSAHLLLVNSRGVEATGQRTHGYNLNSSMPGTWNWQYSNQCPHSAVCSYV